jgi:hypothetical protein
MAANEQIEIVQSTFFDIQISKAAAGGRIYYISMIIVNFRRDDSDKASTFKPQKAQDQYGGYNND